MSSIILKAFTIVIVCAASVSAFIYLNNVELPESPNLAESVEKPKRMGPKKILISDPKTNKKQLIIIEPPSWLDSTTYEDAKADTVAPATQPESPGGLPDIEFFKFVIEKSRESIPVLSLNNYINFFW